MYTNFFLDVAGNLACDNMCYVITHEQDKEQEWKEDMKKEKDEKKDELEEGGCSEGSAC